MGNFNNHHDHKHHDSDQSYCDIHHKNDDCNKKHHHDPMSKESDDDYCAVHHRHDDCNK